MHRKSLITARTTVFLLILAVLILAGCAANKPGWGDPKSGLILTYQWPQDVSREYTMKAEQNQVMDMNGNTIETNSSSNVSLTVVPKSKEGDNTMLGLTINDMSISINSMAGQMNPDVSQIKGKSFSMTLSPLGKELDISGTEGLVYQVPMSGEQNAANGLRTFFPDLPSEPAPIGYTWTSHDTIHAAENIDLTIIMITKNTLAALETIDGKECVKITGIVTGTIQGSGEQAGMNVALESDMEGTETWYFAYKEGMFVQTAVSIQSEGTIAISGAQNMTMPMTQESKINVKLVK